MERNFLLSRGTKGSRGPASSGSAARHMFTRKNVPPNRTQLTGTVTALGALLYG